MQEKYAEAELLYQRALAIYEQELGPNHPDTAGSLNNLALLYYVQGNYAEAELLYLAGPRDLWGQESGPHHLIRPGACQ